MLATLRRIKDRMSKARIAVVGDVILDRFLYGTVDRISPEAPVPVVDVKREVFRLGGAANVLQNLRALGAEVELIGVVGEDAMSERLRAILREGGSDPSGLLADPGRLTSVKTRVIAQHQQVVRFDREDQRPFDAAMRAQLVARAAEAAERADAVIVSDYGKGIVNAQVMEPLVRRAEKTGMPLAVDPKPQNAACYRGAGVITPNAKETEAMCGILPQSDDDAARAGRELLKRFAARSVLVTRGEKGMTLVEADGTATHIPTRAKDVFDVTGAGDTAISVFTLAWASGADLKLAAALANVASGIVVGKLGTATVTVEEIEQALHEDPAS